LSILENDLRYFLGRSFFLCDAEVTNYAQAQATTRL
jgi:hypothetical protein